MAPRMFTLVAALLGALLLAAVTAHAAVGAAPSGGKVMSEEPDRLAGARIFIVGVGGGELA